MLANCVEVGAIGMDLGDDGPGPGARCPAKPPAPAAVASRVDGFAGTQPDVLIASGLLAHEADEVAAAFARERGLHEAAAATAASGRALPPRAPLT